MQIHKILTLLLSVFALFVTSSADASSIKARAKSNGGAAMRYGAVMPYAMTPGVDGFFNVGPKLQIGLAAYGGSLDESERRQEYLDEEVEDNTIQVDKAVVAGHTTLLQARYFLGNSFYVGLAGGQRRIHYTTTLMTEAGREIEGEVLANTTVVNFTVGNQWAFDNGFFIGFDWVGLSSASGGNAEIEFSTNGDVIDNESLLEEKTVAKYVEDTERLSTGSNLMLAVLAFGWMM